MDSNVFRDPGEMSEEKENVSVEAMASTGCQEDEEHKQHTRDGDLNDANVENWLIEHQEKATTLVGINEAATEQQSLIDNTGSQDDHDAGASLPREYNIENHHVEMPQQEGASNSTTGLNPPINASVESVVGIYSIVRAPVLVIEGRTAKERTKYPVIWIALFVLVLAGVIAGTLAPLLKRCCDSTNAPSHTPTLAPSKDPPYPGNLNWTIGQQISLIAPGDYHVLGIIPDPELFIEITNRTNVNFTVFTFATGKIDDVDISIITKFVTTLWNGHSLDFLLSFTIEGIVLSADDLYDGLVLTSMARYPLEFNLNPTRVNDVTIVESTQYYRNGVMIFISGFPTPYIPWVEKSLYDILIEANIRRGGDLSTFISIVNNTVDFKKELQAHGTGATTLFAPTNENLSTSMGNLTIFLNNHIAVGNVATRAWKTIPTGIILNDTHLSLETFGGTTLVLAMTQPNITINGDATIIESDLFSEFGIVHIIDKPIISAAQK